MKDDGRPLRSKIAPARLKRSNKEVVLEEEPKATAVSLGPVDKVIELAFNPTREKIREVTIIDRVQGRLFPILDMIITGRDYILEVAMFREDAAEYRGAFKRERPICPNLLDEFMFRSAQWQKSVQGKNLERATDIALAETESKGVEEEITGGADAWKED